LSSQESSSGLVGAADRAGSAVREQIASMAEAAQGTAAEIERTARDSAQASRKEALEAADGIARSLQATDRELSLLLRSLSQEADQLRAKLDRARLLSAAPGAGASRLSSTEPPEQVALEGEAETIEAAALGAPAATEPAGGGLEAPATDSEEVFEEFPQPAPDAGAAQGWEAEAGEMPPGERDTSDAAQSPPEPEPVPVPEPVSEPETDPETETEEDKTAIEPAFARVTGSEADDAAVEENVSGADGEVPFPVSSGAGADSRTLEEDARAHVTRKSDLELADLYRISSERASEPGGDEQEAYWRALLSATVQEAASRPQFGDVEANTAGGRRERKRRVKLLAALSEARDEVLRGAEEGADSESPQSDDSRG